MKDGWHIAAGYRVYVEDGKVLRGILGEGDFQRSAYPYRWDGNVWTECTGITIHAFRAGVKRETMILW